MRHRVIAVILILIIGVGIFVGIYGLQQNLFNTFDPDSRYQSQRLDYMGVIYANRSTQYGFFEGYSETNSCPWGFIHVGIDYFFYNNTEVVAAAPGYVESISWRVNPDTTLNMYNIYIMIRFNSSIVLHYGFEPFTHVEGDQNRQLSMIEVQVGDWVMKGDVIARFLHVEEGAHIHFGVRPGSGDQWLDPEPFFGSADHDEIMGLIHDYHPGWNLSYPAP
jgi:murein DD-endopeptidase MepM/ murein hydrolase activator NlpD